jgi:hypothetical protein
VIQHLHTAQQIMGATKDGSPFLLEAVGRLCGLGDAERNALARAGIPSVVWGVAGVAGGVFLGAYLYRKYPQQMRKLVGGGS